MIDNDLALLLNVFIFGAICVIFPSFVAKLLEKLVRFTSGLLGNVKIKDLVIEKYHIRVLGILNLVVGVAVIYNNT
jgi:hypothetical protein